MRTVATVVLAVTVVAVALAMASLSRVLLQVAGGCTSCGSSM